MFRALLMREWWLKRRLLLSMLLVALAAVLLVPGDRPVGLLFFGIIPALGAGLSLGGEERARGTLEFLLTRPVRRGLLLSCRFILGLLFLAAMTGFFVLADALDSYVWFWSTVTEGDPWLDWPRALSYPFVTSCLAFLLALALFIGSAVAWPRRLLFKWPLAIALAWVTAAFLINATASLLGERNLGQVVSAEPGRELLAAELLLASLGFFLLARAHALRQEL
ncbi:MAG: hypothetical protein AB1486_16015 [Planctomycetota bacterium]